MLPWFHEDPHVADLIGIRPDWDSQLSKQGHGACDAARFVLLCNWAADLMDMFLNLSTSVSQRPLATWGILWDKFWIYVAGPSRETTWRDFEWTAWEGTLYQTCNNKAIMAMGALHQNYERRLGVVPACEPCETPRSVRTKIGSFSPSQGMNNRE